MSKRLILNTLLPSQKSSYTTNTSPQLFSTDFRSLKRVRPMLDKPKQNFFNKTITFPTSYEDKIKQFGLFKTFLKANSTIGFTNFIPHASQRIIFIHYSGKGAAFSSISRFYSH